MNSNWEQLADILVHYSTRVQPHEKVLITMVEPETFPLARAVHAETVRSGGLPHVEFQSAYLERDLMRYGTPEQLAWVPDLQAYGMEWADVYVGLRGARNPHEFAGIPADRIAAHRRAMGTVSALRNEHTRWVLVRVPNESLAQQAGTSLEEMMAFFFQATLRDWEAEARQYRARQEQFEAATRVRLTGAGTDLCFSTHGRHYEVGDGRHNMPDGEIFTAPVDDSAEGEITFEFPGIFSGQTVEGIHLTFQQGRVVHAEARTGGDLLDRLLDTDPGARRLGEFGVGTNFGIDRFCYDILYDEKIGGTVHLALGRAYAECGGVNASALHWDLIKDLRTEGAIYLDDHIVFEAGRYLA